MKVMQFLQIGMMVLPRLIDMVSHYSEMGAIPEGGALTTADKERMKSNLQSLRFPKWDDL